MKKCVSSKVHGFLFSSYQSNHDTTFSAVKVACGVNFLTRFLYGYIASTNYRWTWIWRTTVRWIFAYDRRYAWSQSDAYQVFVICIRQIFIWRTNFPGPIESVISKFTCIYCLKGLLTRNTLMITNVTSQQDVNFLGWKTEKKKKKKKNDS